jgi:hypothetical protein
MQQSTSGGVRGGGCKVAPYSIFWEFLAGRNALPISGALKQGRRLAERGQEGRLAGPEPVWFDNPRSRMILSQEQYK